MPIKAKRVPRIFTMSNDMDSSLETLGELIFFRKNEENKGTPYPLYAGETTIGNSKDADVRLKLNDDRLKAIHCILDVEENGKVTVTNKSETAPVKVNNVPVKKMKVLKNKDMLEILGKKFQYFKGKEKEMKAASHSKLLNITTVNRHSVSHPIHMKSPKVKTNTSMLVQKQPIRRKSTESSSAEFMEKKTPTRPVMKKALTAEKSKTTSKLLGSKALSSNIPTKIRRLSLGNQSLKKQTPNISSRNITLKSKIISSVIKENENIKQISKNQLFKSSATPKQQQTKTHTPKKENPLVKPSFKNSTRKSLKLEPKAISEIKQQATLDLINFSPPRKSIIKTSFRRSSAKLDSEEISKMVTFQTSSEEKSKQRGHLFPEPRKTTNSDETEKLILSSNTSFASLLEYTTESDDDIFDSDTYATTKSLNLSKSAARTSDTFSKLSDSVSPSKILRSSRRMSKDNPKYYSEDLVTTPRNTSLQAVTPKQKPNFSLRTSTPMVVTNVLLEENSSRRSSGAKKSLNMSRSALNKSQNSGTEMNDITNLTSEEQQGKPSFTDVEEDILARISPIKTSIHKNNSKRLSKSVFENSLSQLSNAEVPLQNSLTNLSRTSKARLSKANVSLNTSNVERKSGRSATKRESFTASSQQPETNEVSFLNNSRKSTNGRQSTRLSVTGNSKPANINFDEEDDQSSQLITEAPSKQALNFSSTRHSVRFSASKNDNISTGDLNKSLESSGVNNDEFSQTPEQGLNTSRTRQSVRLSGITPNIDCAVESDHVHANSSKLDSDVFSNTTRNSDAGFSESKSRRLTKKSLSNLSSANVLNNSSKINDSKVELQSELSLSHVENSPVAIGNISKQKSLNSSGTRHSLRISTSKNDEISTGGPNKSLERSGVFEGNYDDLAQTAEKALNTSRNRQSIRLRGLHIANGMTPEVERLVESEDAHANLSKLDNEEINNTSRNSTILSESMSKSRRLSKKSLSNVSSTNVLNNSSKINDSKVELQGDLSRSHLENSPADVRNISKQKSLNSSIMRHSLRLSTSKNDEISTGDNDLSQTPEKSLNTSRNRQSVRLSGLHITNSTTPKLDRSVEPEDVHGNSSKLDNEEINNISRNSTILSGSMSKSRRSSKKNLSNVSSTNVLNNSSKINDSEVELQIELSRSLLETPEAVGNTSKQKMLNSSGMRHSLRLSTSKNDEIFTGDDLSQTPEEGLNTSHNRHSVRLSRSHFTNGMTPKIDRSVESEDFHANSSKLDNEEVSNTSRNSIVLPDSMSKSRRLSKKSISNMSSTNILNNSSKINDSKVELQIELSRSHIENSPEASGKIAKQRNLNSSSMRHSLRLSTSKNDISTGDDFSQTPEKVLNTSRNRQSVKLSGSHFTNVMTPKIDQSVESEDVQANSRKLDSKEVSNTSRNSTILSESISKSRRLSKKSLSNVSSTNVLNNSSKINDSKVELQSELSRSHVENSPPFIGNISKQRRSRSSIKALDSSDLENDRKENSELLIEFTDSGPVQANESVRSIRKSKRSQSLVELMSKSTETNEDNFSVSTDKNETISSPMLSRKSGRKSEFVPEIENVNSLRKSTRISRNSLEKSFPKAKGRIAMLKAERSKSLDKGFNDIHSQKTSLRRRAGKSLGVNFLQNVSDSDKIVLTGAKGNKLSVSTNLESIQNSSYKESFGDSFISSKTSTPRRISSKSTKAQLKVSDHLNRNESTVSAIEIVDEVITLNSSSFEDSLTEKERALLATPTPIKYSSTEGRSRISQRNSSQKVSENSSKSSEFSVLFTTSDSINTSEETSTSRVSKTRNSSFSPNALVMPMKTPTPRKSSRLQNVDESPYTPTCTPKNNVSIVEVDTPFERSARSPKLSKTLNSLIIDESELTTPKTALKGTRAKSLPYKPITEDISPASPIKTNRDDSGFKTPFNTPGLFENIRESVIKSRSRLLRTTSTLEDTPGDKSAETRAPKRPRESTGESVRLNKRRKIGRNVQELDFTSGSFSSFHSDDVIPELSKLDTTATPPAHFENLTDKPFVVEPETKRQRRSQKFKLQKSPKNDLSDVAGLKRLLKTPRVRKGPNNDLSNVAGVKKLMSTPKPISSPKNDLTNVPGIKKLFSDEVKMKSPKNDLTNVAGVKKLLSTPKRVKSPKNDLTNVVGLKKLMSTPKNIKSPKNDLTNVAGVKKLMSTPKELRSPKNDLTKVAGVKKLMSTPKVLKSPKNDLTNVAGVKKLLKTPQRVNSPRNDLSDVTGVRRLMSTPKEMKSPRNDLTKIGSIRNLMSPKPMTSPKNDLSNVEGLVSLFAEHRNSNISDQENNEDLFARIFDKKPLKTYRGKSISPFKREDLQPGSRKTLGDVPITSPRVENWVQEQVKLKQEQLASAVDSSKKYRKPKQIEKEVSNASSNAPVEIESSILNLEEIMSPAKVTKKSTRGRKNITEASSIPEQLDSKGADTNEDSKNTSKNIDIMKDPIDKSDTQVRGRSRRKKVDESPIKIPNSINSSMTKQTDTPSEQMEKLDTPVKGRGRRKKVGESPLTVQNSIDSTTSKKIETPSEQVEKLDTPVKGRGRRRKVDESPITIQNSIDSTAAKKIETPSEHVEKLDPPVKGRVRRRKVEESPKKIQLPVVSSTTKQSETPSKQIEKLGTPVKARGRRKKVDESASEQIEELDVPVKGRGRRRKVDESPINIQNSVDSSSTKEIETPEQVEKLDTPVKGRGRRKKVDETPTEQIEELDAPVKGRGRRKKVVESPVEIEQVEIKRGRVPKKGNKDVTENTEKMNVKEVENQDNQPNEKNKPESKESDSEPQEEIKVVRRGRTRMITESAEQHETTPQKTTRGRKKINVVEDVQNNDTDNITSQPITVQKKTRGKKQPEDSSNQETKKLDSAEVEVSTRRGRRNLKDNNENENENNIEKETDKPETKARGGSRKNKNQETKVTLEDGETAENNIELTSKPRGRGRKQVDIIEEGSPKNTEQKSGRTTRKGGKNNEGTVQENSSVTTKRTRKALVEDIPVKEIETVSSPLPVLKVSRNRRNAKTEEDSEDSSEMKKKDIKTVVFAEPIIQSPLKGRRRNVQSDLPEEPVEVRSKRTRRGKNDVEDSKETETLETPPAKRTRRGAVKENPETAADVTEKVEKRTRRK